MALRRRFPGLSLVVWLSLLVVLLVACSGPENDDPTDASNPPTAIKPATSPTAAGYHTATAASHHYSSTETPLVATATAIIQATTPTRTPSATATPVEPTVTATMEPTVAIAEPTATITPVPEPTSAPTTISSASDVLTIRTADTDERIVSLTFDAGADRGFAAEILDTLRDEGVVATFGMTGGWAEENPDLILRMVDEGHTLINHTQSHRSFTGFSTGAAPLTSEERASELQATEDIIRDLTGYDLRPYFRPPYGDYDDSVLADLAANGYTVNVMWTVDSLGWRGLSADEITRRVVDGTVPGAIHLFHVGAQSQDAAALPSIISELRAAGYRFVTVNEMVGR